MHLEVLDKHQSELLPFLSVFKRKYYLAGGTAIAIHLGHRRSIDFDLFTGSPIVKTRLKKKLSEIPFDQAPLFEDVDQLHLMLNKVKITFFYYPFRVEHNHQVSDFLKMPSLLSLAAMKAFALGRRAKWKDYVDLYYILRDHHTIEEINQECTKIFGNQYAEKLFRQQLAFHKDIDFSEPVDFMVNEIPEKEIKEFLIEKATSIL
jgi:hypothetical protein